MALWWLLGKVMGMRLLRALASRIWRYCTWKKLAGFVLLRLFVEKRHKELRKVVYMLAMRLWRNCTGENLIGFMLFCFAINKLRGRISEVMIRRPQLPRYIFDVLAFFTMVWSRGVAVWWMKWLYLYTNVIHPGAQEHDDFLASINPVNQVVALAQKIKGESPRQKKKKPTKKSNAPDPPRPAPISKDLTSMERRIRRGQGMRRSDLQSFVLENSIGNEGSVKRTGKRNIS